MSHEIEVRAAIGEQYLEHIDRMDPGGILGAIAREGLVAMRERGQKPEVWEPYCFECQQEDRCRLAGECCQSKPIRPFPCSICGEPVVQGGRCGCP